ncbi:MAG: hypothetical protein ACE5KC_01090 [Candidatus Bathyarchaeia archaeon]
MTAIPIRGPYVFLRCRKCGRRTDHDLIKTAVTEEGEIEATYRCQECGETKRIYELASVVRLHSFSLPQQPTTRKGKLSGIRTRIAKVREILDSTFTIGVFNLVLACSFSLVFCQPSCLLMAKNLLQVFCGMPNGVGNEILQVST